MSNNDNKYKSLKSFQILDENNPNKNADLLGNV